jgi:outer membrane protein
VVKFVRLVTVSVVLLLPMLGASKVFAEGKVAVLDAQAAILATDEAQKRMKTLREKPEFKANQAELDKLKKEYNSLLEQVKKEIAVMSPEQKDAQGKKIEAKRSDIEHVVRKLQAAEQELGQSLMQDMGPKMQKAVTDVIKSENIGLLLDRRAALHADAGYNITPKVTDLLNKAGQ